MNPVVEAYFDRIELHLLQSSAVRGYQIIRREIGLADGKLRLRAILIDDGLLELFEYVGENAGQLQTLKYSFHWQDAQGKLNQRWDNAPHYPHLSSAPHHIHIGDQRVEPILDVPSTLTILERIEQVFLRNKQ